MRRKWFLLGMIILTGFNLLLSPETVALSQEPTPENDANCVACHEHQYYLYDSGKWFCLCDAPMHCVYCHGGRTDSTVKDIAHQDLVLYPTRNHAERCQACHSEDYVSRLVTFESAAGVNITPIPMVTATPGNPAEISTDQSPVNAVLLHLSRLESWQMIGLGVLLLAMIAILILAYRCWKSDCLVNSQA
jgi:hypothetical protein